jgi:hypothetical protein
MDQSEVWGAHRCGRRAYPVKAQLDERLDGVLTFTGAHNGYRHLKGNPMHQRTITWAKDKLLVDDSVDGRGIHDVEIRLHVHPDLEIEVTEDKAVFRERGEILASVTPHGSGMIHKAEGWYCPEFGIKLPCVVLVVKHNNVRLPFSTGWAITTGN